MSVQCAVAAHTVNLRIYDRFQIDGRIHIDGLTMMNNRNGYLLALGRRVHMFPTEEYPDELDKGDAICEGCGRSMISRFGWGVGEECEDCQHEWDILWKAGKVVEVVDGEDESLGLQSS